MASEVRIAARDTASSATVANAQALVVMAGVSGFHLASSLGFSKQVIGTDQTGFLVFAALALTALAGLTLVKGKWRTRWDVAATGVRI